MAGNAPGSANRTKRPFTIPKLRPTLLSDMWTYHSSASRSTGLGNAGTMHARSRTMSILRLAADERFVNLDNPHELAEILVLQASADAMAHVPSRPIRAGADHAMNLEGANPLLARQNKVDHAEPCLEGPIRVFERGPYRDREPIAIRSAISALQIERLVVRCVRHLFVSAASAANAIWPTLADEISATGFLIGEGRLKLRDGHLLGAGHGSPLSIGGYCHAEATVSSSA